mgnify:CR=1 FL=1
MAWIPVVPIIGSAQAKGLVRYRVTQKLGAIVTLPTAIVEALGWREGVRIGLAVGGGEVAGKLRLAEDAAAPAVLRLSKGGSHVVRLGRWAQLPDREVERIAVACAQRGAGGAGRGGAALARAGSARRGADGVAAATAQGRCHRAGRRAQRWRWNRHAGRDADVRRGRS